MQAHGHPAEECLRLIVVGASAGGVDSLREFVSALPADLPAAVLVVLHMSPHSTSVLPRILARGSRLPVRGASGTEPLTACTVVVARPDHHLLVVDGRSHVSRGPHENGHRPAVDALFRSAARSHGARVVAVVLSGTLDDGTVGAVAVHGRGGIVLAQDPGRAAYPSMPRSVIEHVPVTATGTPTELARVAAEVCATAPASGSAESSDGTLSLMIREAQLTPVATPDADVSESPNRSERLGAPTGYACPDCDGMLFQRDDDPHRYRCRAGHAWTPRGLLAEQATALDSALWMALRSLEEKAALSKHLAERAAERGSVYSEERFLTQADEATQSASLVRELLERPSIDGSDASSALDRVSDV